MRRQRALALLGSSLAGFGYSRAANAQTTGDQIRVVGVPTEGATNMFYAIKSGAFERAGLSVEQISMGSGAAAVAAVIGGTYEVGYTSLMSVINAHMRGIALVVIAAANLHVVRDPLALLQAAADSTFKTGSDLNGKTAGVPALNDLNTISIRAWVDKNGGDWRSVKFVELPNSTLEAALQQHRIDVAVIQSPQLFSSLAAGTTRTVADSWGAIAPRFTAGLYVTRADWAASHKEALRRFFAAYNQATLYTASHPTETAPYAAELTKTDLGTVLKMHRANYATTPQTSDFQPLIDAAAKYGADTKTFPARELFAVL